MKSFEIDFPMLNLWMQLLWTINLKSFEIADKVEELVTRAEMNYKLEKFWNQLGLVKRSFPVKTWTINLKSFEI